MPKRDRVPHHQTATMPGVAGQDGTAVIATLRREAMRGVLGLSAVTLAANIGALAVPLYNMEVFNRVMTTHNLRTLAGLTLGLAIALLFYIVIDHLRAQALTILGDRFGRTIAPVLLQAAYAGAQHEADPMQALRDAETLRHFVSGPLLSGPFDLMWTPVLLVVLFVMGWAFAALAASCVCAMVLLSYLGDAVSRRRMMQANEASVQGLRDVAAATRGAEAVLAMGMLSTLGRRWQQSQYQALSAGAGALMRNRAVTSITRALRSGMTGAMVATGLVLVLNGYAASGSLIAGNMILARILMPFEHFSESLRQWAEAAVAWRRVRALLQQKVAARYTQPLPRPTGDLVVERLVFLPPGAERAVLRGLSFQIAPGEVVGIVGPSASGKSTLLKLILGMMEPTSGGVYLDGHSTYLWAREDLARHVGYVPQSAVLTDGTVAENIARAGSPEIDLVIAAAKQAGVHAIIADLPFGYSTRIAGAGFTLSAGQRQRIALARALYGRPQLLILDEPNAFLDQAGEAMLTGLIARLRADGVCVLISSHRPAVLQFADKLLELREGAIVQFGPREAVLPTISAPQGQVQRTGERVALP